MGDLAIVPWPAPAPADYEQVDSLDAAEAEATGKGLVVRYPEPNELFIDIDSAAQFAEHTKLLAMFQRGEACAVLYTPSPSGLPGRQHCVVTLQRPVRDAAERVHLQALLGSDLKREMLGWLRHQRGADEKRTSLFFEKPGAVEAAFAETVQVMPEPT